MTDNNAEPGIRVEQLRATIITALPLVLPLVVPGLAWLHTLVPMVVFYRLVVSGAADGSRTGSRIVTQALLLAALAALLSGSYSLFFLGFIMLPLGYVLAWCHQKGDGLSWTGLLGFGYLVLLWLAIGIYAQTGDAPGPVDLVRDSLEQSLSTALEEAPDGGIDLPPPGNRDEQVVPPSQGRLSEEQRRQLSAAFDALRDFVNRAWPALFAISFIAMVWLNMLGGHWLLRRSAPGLSKWPEFKEWRLPDHFVAVAALATVLLFLRMEPVVTLGINGALILGMLYLMQGLAVMATLLAHWNIAPLLRAIAYALVLLQIYGMILLILLGLAEVKINFRRRLQEPGK